MRLPGLKHISARRQWFAIGVAVFMLASAVVVWAAPWSSDSASEVPATTPTPTEMPTLPPTPTSTPEPTPSPTPENRLTIVYVAHTDGDGVSLRDACSDDARVPGAWAEGTAVRVIDVGSDECAGWTYVAGPGEGSWVRDDYLSETAPAGAPPVSSGGGGGGTPTSTTSPAAPPSGSGPMFVSGDSSPGDLVTVFAGGSYCAFARADPAVGLWAVEIGAGTECHPAVGAALSFSLNGQAVQTASAHTYQPGGTATVTFLP